MEELPPAAPVGWYPGPDGTQRYWDGRSWLAIPPPDDAPARPPHQPPNSVRAKARKRGRVVAVVTALALIGLGVGGYAVKNAHDATQAAVTAEQDARSRDEQAAIAKAQSDAVEADRSATEAKKAKVAKEAKDAKAAADKAERILGKDSVSEIEKSVKKMARGHVKSGLIDGPIIDVSCDPVAGGSVDDLSEKTTVFQCFVADKKNKDGTMSGYYYNATMNWKTGSYTYGYGKP
jgi:hypothetical protein